MLTPALFKPSKYDKYYDLLVYRELDPRKFLHTWKREKTKSMFLPPLDLFVVISTTEAIKHLMKERIGHTQ